MKQQGTTLMPVVRRPQFGLEEGFPKYYVGGKKFTTHMLNSMHVVFPEGERLFIRAVKAYNASVKSPELAARIKAFIAQETIHGAQHERLWKMLDAQGVNATEYGEWYKTNAYSTVEGFLSGIVGEDFTKRMRLSVTAALEHYTATLAMTAVRNDAGLNATLHPTMRALMNWHAIEEIEHKDVAFDVMKEVDGSELTKNLGMVVGTWGLMHYLAIGWAKFVWEDKEINKWEIPRLIIEDVPVLLGLAAAMAPSILEYFRPDFHPNDLGGDEYIEQYLAENPQYFAMAKSG
jgi:predicted metal-dependent hydrolase